MATDRSDIIPDIIDQAIAWHVRLAGGDEGDWATFIAWLEASPAHQQAYDAIAMDDRLIANARFPDVADAPVRAADNDNNNDRAPHRGRWLWGVGGTAVAAALAVALLAPGMLHQAAPYSITTGAGERRTVALDDGTSIEMSGGTVLKLDRSNPRVATLDRGEAVFHVRHDAANPFTMTTAGVTIRDTGTIFNVERSGDRVAVAVAEGSVLFQPGRNAVAMAAGDMVSAHADGSDLVRTRVSPGLVGSWRNGMVSFDNRQVGDVAATLGRLYGIDIRLDGSLSARPFTGMVRFTGAADRDVPHLAGLIGATWRRDGKSWILSQGAPASR